MPDDLTKKQLTSKGRFPRVMLCETSSISSPDNFDQAKIVIECLKNEKFVLDRKLASKSAASSILSQELEQCRQDRDQFRSMVEQFKDSSCSKDSLVWSYMAGDVALTHQLNSSRQRCTQLEETVADLTLKLDELTVDLRLLRESTARDRCVSSCATQEQQREDGMLADLELFQNQCEQLRRDLGQLVGEKEELELDKETLKCKVHRQNHQLARALSGSTRVDIDALICENRHLKPLLMSAKEEIIRLTRANAKYKKALEPESRKRGPLRLGSTASASPVVTKRQIDELLRSRVDSRLTDTPDTLSDLRSLCSALLEQLEDKCTALSHQRKTCRLLAENNAQLRVTLKSHGVCVEPSEALMQGYSGSGVDQCAAETVRQAVDSTSDVTTVDPISDVTNVDPISDITTVDNDGVSDVTAGDNDGAFDVTIDDKDTACYDVIAVDSSSDVTAADGDVPSAEEGGIVVEEDGVTVEEHGVTVKQEQLTEECKRETSGSWPRYESGDAAGLPPDLHTAVQGAGAERAEQQLEEEILSIEQLTRYVPRATSVSPPARDPC